MKEKLVYDENAPSCVSWKTGGFAGTLRSDGYWRVGHDKHYVHRLIWEILFGEIPAGICIDHIDRNPSNNKIDNLRLVTHKENMNNCKIRSDNKTGIVGVTYSTPNGVEYYVVSWREDGKRVNRAFSIKKYGKEEAFRLACEAREEAVDGHSI